jgi:predicted component of type VI protein secretion system
MSSERDAAYVRILTGPQKGVVFVLQDYSVFAIGRAPECQIQLEDEKCDLRHGFITHEGELWAFRDPHSRDDCQVNDIPTSERNLEGGEIIRIGKTELYFTFRKPQPRQAASGPSEDSDTRLDLPDPEEVKAKAKGGTVVVAKKEKVQEETGSFTPEERYLEAKRSLSGVRLVVVDGDPRDIGNELVLPMEGEVLLGRAPECEFSLHDRKMSRCHSRIQRDGDRYRVSDLSSMNGTVVNGLRAASARFGVGDYIRLGFTVIAVQRVREEATVD